MNSTCVLLSNCGVTGLVNVFDRTYTSGPYIQSFFRCANHPCAVDGQTYAVGANSVEWMCYNPDTTATIKNCAGGKIGVKASDIASIAFADFKTAADDSALLANVQTDFAK